MQEANKQRERRGSVTSRSKRNDEFRARGVPREQADLRKLARALIALAMAQAKTEVDAEAEHKKRVKEDTPRAA
jgi:hypothetical protein